MHAFLFHDCPNQTGNTQNKFIQIVRNVKTPYKTGRIKRHIDDIGNALYNVDMFILEFCRVKNKYCKYIQTTGS